MIRPLRWDPAALSDMRALERADRRLAERIRHSAARFAESGHGDVKKLHGAAGLYRLRIGDWRLLFTLSDRDGAVVVVRVLNRRDAYRD